MEKVDKLFTKYEELDAKFDATPDSREDKKRGLIQDMKKLQIKIFKQLKEEYKEMREQDSD